MKKLAIATIEVKGTAVSILTGKEGDYISLTDMLKAKDGEFFISDWLRNRNTVEFLGIWESVFNPDFNYGEFATIRSQAGLNSYKISVKEWVQKTNAIKDTLIPPSITKAQASAVLHQGVCASRPHSSSYRNTDHRKTAPPASFLLTDHCSLGTFRPHQPRKPELRPHPPRPATTRTTHHPQPHRHHSNADPALRQQREAAQIDPAAHLQNTPTKMTAAPTSFQPLPPRLTIFPLARIHST
jgi:hypothetical protein